MKRGKEKQTLCILLLLLLFKDCDLYYLAQVSISIDHVKHERGRMPVFCVSDLKKKGKEREGKEEREGEEGKQTDGDSQRGRKQQSHYSKGAGDGNPILHRTTNS